MNDFRLNDLYVGLRADFVVSISAGSIDVFQSLVGDFNPLHSSLEYANASGFKNRVVNGMLTAGFYSQLVGNYLPGKNALLHRVDTSFLNPVFEGDELSVIGEVVAVNFTVKQIEIKAEMSVNSRRVSRAKIWVGVRE